MNVLIEDDFERFFPQWNKCYDKCICVDEERTSKDINVCISQNKSDTFYEEIPGIFGLSTNWRHPRYTFKCNFWSYILLYKLLNKRLVLLTYGILPFPALEKFQQLISMEVRSSMYYY